MSVQLSGFDNHIEHHAPVSSQNKAPKGNVKGQQVNAFSQAGSALFDVAEASEEMTFKAAEIKKKKVKNRNLNKNNTAKTRLGSSTQDLMNKLPDAKEKLKDSKIDQFVRRILNNSKHGKGTNKDIEREAQTFFDDITLQYLAIEQTEAVLKNPVQAASKFNVTPKEIKALKSIVGNTAEEMLKRDKPKIVAGINCAEAADKYTTDPEESLSPLRDFYRDSVLDFENLSTAYEMIVEKGVGDGLAISQDLSFQQAVEFLVESIAADLSASVSSLEKSKLKLINDDVNKLRKLGNLHEASLNKIQVLRNKNPEMTSDEHVLMRLIVKTIEKGWSNSSSLTKIGVHVNTKKIGIEINLLKFVFDEMAALPLWVFKSAQDQNNVKEMVQKIMDKKIQEEEELIDTD